MIAMAKTPRTNAQKHQTASNVNLEMIFNDWHPQNIKKQHVQNKRRADACKQPPAMPT